MYWLITIPFFVQTLVIGFDEYFFHIKRGLPLWERIGHPIDTLSVLSCFLFILFVPYSAEALKWYIGLSIFSCLMVTKDEWIHKHHCPAAEHWVHALLFLNHPILLTAAGLIWCAITSGAAPTWVAQWLTRPTELSGFLLLQTGFITLFFLYQVIYWNLLWKKNKQAS